MGRKKVETSIEAYNLLNEEHISNHHRKILIALRLLKNGNYEQISQKASMDRHQVARRLNELESKGLVYKPGIKTLTSTGRNSFVYSLTADGKVYSPAPVERVMKGKSVSDFAKEIIQQASLF